MVDGTESDVVAGSSPGADHRAAPGPSREDPCRLGPEEREWIAERTLFLLLSDELVVLSDELVGDGSGPDLGGHVSRHAEVGQLPGAGSSRSPGG
ncbi:MAG: hypothetical protein AB1679_36215 [Actinomycetota bacterium]|jgi:hypothetical protein